MVYFIVMDWGLGILIFYVSSIEFVMLVLIILRFNVSSFEVNVLVYVVYRYEFNVVCS